MKAAQALPKIVGLRIDEARNIGKEAGFTIRVMQRDGESCIGTCDIRDNRINVATDSDEVTDIIGVG